MAGCGSFAQQGQELHVGGDGFGGLCGVGDFGEDGLENIQPSGVFGAHGRLEIGAEFEQERGCLGERRGGIGAGGGETEGALGTDPSWPAMVSAEERAER